MGFEEDTLVLLCLFGFRGKGNVENCIRMLGRTVYSVGSKIFICVLGFNFRSSVLFRIFSFYDWMFLFYIVKLKLLI